MDTENNFNAEDKLLFNGLLFCTLRMHESVNDKLINIEKYLTRGADINTSDANDVDNSPLHIAVKMNETEVVKFLLKKGANPNAMNKNKHKPIDIANMSNEEQKHEIVSILENLTTNPNKGLNQIKLSKDSSLTDVQDLPSNVTRAFKSNTERALTNENRSGTAGIRGQLYETKLLGLLLHRAIYDHEIDKFYLGGNVTELGAFDDIVFKYYLKNETRPKIIFVQAKHKENPTKQAKFTVQSLVNNKSDNDFNLMKFFNSYLKVKSKFNINSKNEMFCSDYNNIDCKFIIYTSAIEDFHVDKKKPGQNKSKEKLLLTCDLGKTFMYQYEHSDLEVLLLQTSLSTAKSLAIIFAEYLASQIRKGNLKNMMWNDLIRVYHVFLAQNVVYISNSESKHYLLAKFRKSFLESTDEDMTLMRETMINVFRRLSVIVYGIFDLEFKLPTDFGNFCVSYNEEKYVNVVTKLINLKSEPDITIAVNDEMVGRQKLFTKYELKLIGNLVGEALILDIETGFLKFNLGESSSDKTKKLFKELNVIECNLGRLRLDITVQNFPQLTLSQHQKRNLKDFLNKLYFFTNQSREDEVENILKKEISNVYRSEATDKDTFIHIKSDVIYYQYHDSIQKWWKEPKKKVYLTKTCEFYKEAKENIIKSPLIDINNYSYIQKINSYQINFNQKAMDILGLKTFMDRSDINIFYIITKDKALTSLKVKQYFANSESKIQLLNYKFIDLNILASESDIETILAEIRKSTLEVIIIILSDESNKNDIEINFISQPYNKKVVIISHSNYLSKNVICVEKTDQNNSLCDFDTTTKNRIIDQQNILFQGSKMPFKTLVKEKMYDLVKGKILHNVIKKDEIKIGKIPVNIEVYNNAKEFYIDRYVCRCLILSGKQYHNDFHVIHNKGMAAAKNDKDILIISNDYNVFTKNCKKHSNKNIYWFQKIDGNKILLRKSKGSLKNIIPLVKRVNCKGYDCSLLAPKTLTCFEDRVVVISAGPGMGKSTLLTHLTMQTKQIDKSMCVIQINLIDLKNELSTWQDCNEGIKLIWLMSVLYKSFSNYQTNFIESAGQIAYTNINDIRNITLVDSRNRIYLNNKEAKIKNSENELALFEFQAFLNSYNNNKMALVFDGFDEICPDYKKEAIELFKLLLSSRLKHLWITSRSNIILNELECELNTFSFTLIDFTIFDQIEFLEKFWGSSISKRSFSFIQNKPIKNLNTSVNNFFNTISYKIKDHQKDFTGIPLHLLMIAEIFQEYFIKYYSYNDYSPQFSNDLNDAFNLISLYEQFIDTKFNKIRFGEKKDGLSRNDPDIKIVIDEVRSSFIQNHMKLAAYSLFNKTSKNDKKTRPSTVGNKRTQRNDINIAGLLTEDDLKNILDFVEKLKLGKEKTGIIEIIQNELKFVHYSYAEYFASQFISEKLKNNVYSETTWMYFVNHILVMDNEGIRGFIDSKLEKDQILSQFTAECISDALLSQRHSNKSALHLAVAEDRSNIALFLLNNLNMYLNTNNVDDFITMLTKKFTLCTLCQMYNRGNNKVMTRVTEIIMRLDCYKLQKLFFCKDNPKSNIFMITFLYHSTSFHRDNTDIILKYTNSTNITKLLTITLVNVFGKNKYPILHILVQYSTDIIYMQTWLKKLNKKQRITVFCTGDDLQRIPAHWAAMYNNYAFFDLMADFVTKDEFKKICTTSDKHGQIPLKCFSVPFTLSKFEALCAKAGFGITFKEGGGYFLYDEDIPDCTW